MELFRKKNIATTFVFPLLSAGSSTYYFQDTWGNLTNRSLSAYSWSDAITIPTATTISGTPSRLASTGLWSLSAAANEMNPNSGNDDYIAIKLNADEIEEQTILVILTDYSVQESVKVGSTTNGAMSAASFDQDYYEQIKEADISAINEVFSFSGDNTAFTVSAYENFPSVNVSSIDGTVEDGLVDKVWEEPDAGYTTSGTMGYDVSLLPRINDNVGVVAAGVPTNFVAISDEATIGDVVAGNFSSTWNNDDIYYQIQTSGGNGLDVNLTFNIGTTNRVSQVTINGRFNPGGGGRFCNVFAYNYITSAYAQISDAVTRLNNSTVDQEYTYNMLAAYQSTSGLVNIRFEVTSTNNGDNLYLDQVLVNGIAAGATPEEIAQAVYDKMVFTMYEGSIWIDTINGTAGTDLGINGLPTNPVDNLADAITLADSLGVKRFTVLPGSTITLSQPFVGWLFNGSEYTVNGSSWDVGGSVFAGAITSGVFLGDSGIVNFNDCTIGSVSLPISHAHACGIEDNMNLTSPGDYFFDQCYSQIAGSDSPSATFAVGTNANFRHYSGGILIDGYTSANEMSLEGFGQLKFGDNCTGGSISIRGTIRLGTAVPAGVTLVDTSRYEIDQPVGSVTNPITVSAYQNFPDVNVSGMDQSVINEIQSGLASATGNDNIFAEVSGLNGNAMRGTDGALTSEFSVNVSSVSNGAITSAGLDDNVYDNINVVLETSHGTGSWQSLSGDNTQAEISAGALLAIQASEPIDANIVSVDTSAITSADFAQDYYDKIETLETQITIPDAVRISAVDGGLYIGTSAYQNLPSVNVSSVDNDAITSGDLHDNVYDNINVVLETSHGSGSWQSLSGDNTQAEISAGALLAIEEFAPPTRIEATSDKDEIISDLSATSAAIASHGDINWASSAVKNTAAEMSAAAVLAIDDQFEFSGSDVKAFVTNQVTTNGTVTVSAYENFPSVNVSSVDTSAITSADFNQNYYDKMESLSPQVTIPGAVQVSAIDGGLYVGTSAFLNEDWSTVSDLANTSAAIATYGDLNWATSAVKNTAAEMSAAAVLAIDNQFTFSGINVQAYSVNEGAVTSGVTVGSMTSGAVQDILSGVVDTKTLSDIFTLLLADAVGNIDRTDHVVTYFKQDGTTVAFQNTMTTVTRRRTD